MPEPTAVAAPTPVAEPGVSQGTEAPKENVRRSRKRKLPPSIQFQQELLEEQSLLRQAFEEAAKEERVLRERQVNAQERLVDLLGKYFNKT